MEHLTSPKITIGVHCLVLRHKGMYVMSVPDPDESQFYDTRLRLDGLLVRRDADRLRPGRPAGPARRLPVAARLLPALGRSAIRADG